MDRQALVDRDETKPSKSCMKRNLIYFLLIVIIVGLSIATIFGWIRKTSSSPSRRYAIDGSIGFPSLLPNDGTYVQWTFLHMNDVYELLPLNNGKRGGLARVARVRQLFKSENSHTYTLLAGDLVSPSALGQAIVNGTALKGLQMIATMNTLGLDYMTFGNHEFDLKEPDLLQRMSESKFTWISTNVFNKTSGNNLSYASSIPYKLLTISNVRILIFGLTIDMNTGGYVTIINSTSLVPFVREFLRTLENKSVEYDVLIGLTHLDLKTDIDLVENIPGIDVIFGGHEHEDYYLVRGLTYTPIYKADDNAISVYIHRCAFNVNKKLFRIYSTLARITSDIDDEPETAKVANYWFNMGMQGFIDKGFEPNKTVAILPPDVQLDGRSTSVRNFPTLLSNYSCECMVKETESNGTIIGLSNSGSIRVDDVLTGIITQYDVLRTLPFDNYVMSLSVPGALLSKVLTTGLSAIGSGMFVSYTGVHTNDNGATWLLNQDGTNIATSGENYNVATTDFEKYNTGLNDSSVIVLQQLNTTQTKSLINYLQNIYPH
ncbi:unnamed protein product [Didymodactylos carnosus]|uniref:5'-nucleotidase n=1 Tax=Didymodactylos carnosus TaxID=1234261 RepID=A0A8S2SXK7_9BILA|nr:unnamed protein product [Didymodactylos carnosus]CAF4249098.1 unnamed protein product [Didymodactylos carnosus]